MLSKVSIALLSLSLFLVTSTRHVRGAEGKKASTDSDTNILGSLAVLEGLDTLLVLGHEFDTAAGVGATVARLGGVAEEAEVQGNLALLLAIGGEEVKLAAHGAGLDLFQGDGSEANGGICTNVLFHDLDIEDAVLVGGTLEDNGLVPGGVRTTVLVGLGLLKRLCVLDVERELGVGIVLAHGLYFGRKRKKDELLVARFRYPTAWEDFMGARLACLWRKGQH